VIARSPCIAPGSPDDPLGKGDIEFKAFAKHREHIVHFTVLNRDGLEDCACECYSVIRAETDKFMGPAQIHSEPGA
jgi:hypothetical protein